MTPRRSVPARRRALAVPTLLAVVCAVSSCSGGSVTSPTAGSGPDPTTTLPDPGTVDLWIDFDDSFGPEGSVIAAPDSAGTVSVRTAVATAAGARLRRAPGIFGTAARFDVGARPVPAASGLDTRTPATAVVVDVAGVDGLSPGQEDFEFGADFFVERVAGADDAGDNLVQRGLFGEAAQYKLQVDGDVPSCHVRGETGIASAGADDRVVPGRWYRALCQRDGPRLTLVLSEVSADGSVLPVGTWVDEATIGPVVLPADTPLTIGAKTGADGAVVASDPDPFDGLVDNVLVSVGRLDPPSEQ